MELRTNLQPSAIHIASVAVHFLIEMATNAKMERTPFYHYIFLPFNLNKCFLLASLEDAQTMALNALGASRDGRHVRYQCTCGCILEN